MRVNVVVEASIRIGRIEFSNHNDMLRDLLYSVGDEVNQVIFEDCLKTLSRTRTHDPPRDESIISYGDRPSSR